MVTGNSAGFFSTSTRSASAWRATAVQPGPPMVGLDQGHEILMPPVHAVVGQVDVPPSTAGKRARSVERAG